MQCMVLVLWFCWLCLPTFFVIRTIQIHTQKQNFAKAEASLDALAKQIEAKVGKPDDIKKEKSCGYASRVYEKGPRGCSISIFLFFSGKDSTQATGLTSQISPLVSNKEVQRLGEITHTFVPFDQYRGDQTLSQAYYDIGSLSCSVQYVYPVSKKLNQPFEPKESENLQLELSCGGVAMAEFFPVKY